MAILDEKKLWSLLILVNELTSRLVLSCVELYNKFVLKSLFTAPEKVDESIFEIFKEMIDEVSLHSGWKHLVKWILLNNKVEVTFEGSFDVVPYVHALHS